MRSRARQRERERERDDKPLCSVTYKVVSPRYLFIKYFSGSQFPVKCHYNVFAHTHTHTSIRLQSATINWASFPSDNFPTVRQPVKVHHRARNYIGELEQPAEFISRPRIWEAGNWSSAAALWRGIYVLHAGALGNETVLSHQWDADRFVLGPVCPQEPVYTVYICRRYFTMSGKWHEQRGTCPVITKEWVILSCTSVSHVPTIADLQAPNAWACRSVVSRLFS